MTLSNATNATISDATGTFSIVDDDATPSLSINDVSTSDESNAATNMTVTLSAASGRDVTVDFATSNGTATAGSDYTARSGTLTISAGATTGTIAVTVLADSLMRMKLHDLWCWWSLVMVGFNNRDDATPYYLGDVVGGALLLLCCIWKK